VWDPFVSPLSPSFFCSPLRLVILLPLAVRRSFATPTLAIDTIDSLFCAYQFKNQATDWKSWRLRKGSIHSFIHPLSHPPVCQESPSLDRQLISIRHTRTAKGTNAFSEHKEPPSKLQFRDRTSLTQPLISPTARISHEVYDHPLCRCGAPLWIRRGLLAHALPLEDCVPPSRSHC
jgi:hypothetical protein